MSSAVSPAFSDAHTYSIRGKDGSRQVTAILDPTATGGNFNVNVTVVQNGDLVSMQLKPRGISETQLKRISGSNDCWLARTSLAATCRTKMQWRTVV